MIYISTVKGEMGENVHSSQKLVRASYVMYLPLLKLESISPFSRLLLCRQVSLTNSKLNRTSRMFQSIILVKMETLQEMNSTGCHTQSGNETKIHAYKSAVFGIKDVLVANHVKMNCVYLNGVRTTSYSVLCGTTGKYCSVAFI